MVIAPDPRVTGGGDGGTKPLDSPLDRALGSLLAGDREEALRWSAAAVQHDSSSAGGLILTGRLLADAGDTKAGMAGLQLAILRAIDAGNLPLAVAAAGDLRSRGVDIDACLRSIAAAFCRGSPRLADGRVPQVPPPPPLPVREAVEPLPPTLTGAELLAHAVGVLADASAQYETLRRGTLPPIAPVALFSALDEASLHALIAVFHPVTAAEGTAVIAEGDVGAEAFIVARGELEVVRAGSDGKPITLARLATGALFGEMALLARARRSASVVARRPSILLVASRDDLEAAARKRPRVAAELAAHCRRRMVANLGRTSQVLLAVDPEVRPALVERFETRTFEKDARLIAEGRESPGLYLIASGEVAVVGHEKGEPFVLATLGPGDTVGEVALILRRKANADVVAVTPTVTLHLPRDQFLGLVKAHPAVLSALYFVALERDDETASALERSTSTVSDDYIII